MIRSDFHLHTFFSDGKNTPEEMVLAAIEKGMTAIGFSDHSYTAFDESYCMSQKDTKEYKECVNALKDKYKGKIKVLLGIEQDFYSEESVEGYDYVIGGVHYVNRNGVYLPVDESKEALIQTVCDYYSGDYYSFCEDYFENVAALYERTKCDIVAHFDLVTKFNENNVLFDTQNRRYKAAAYSALESLMKAPVRFEINTGAVSRGYRQAPYPSADILDILKKNGNELILGSDCHDKEYLLFGFEKYSHLVLK